jgi:hypothetical protein
MKYIVTVWKTETYRTEVEVEAINEDEAMESARADVIDRENVNWEFIEGDIEPDMVEEVSDETGSYHIPSMQRTHNYR